MRFRRYIRHTCGCCILSHIRERIASSCAVLVTEHRFHELVACKRDVRLYIAVAVVFNGAFEDIGEHYRLKLRGSGNIHIYQSSREHRAAGKGSGHTAYGVFLPSCQHIMFPFPLNALEKFKAPPVPEASFRALRAGYFSGYTCQLPRYFSCSGVSLSISNPQNFILRSATARSTSFGTLIIFSVSLPLFFTR